MLWQPYAKESNQEQFVKGLCTVQFCRGLGPVDVLRHVRDARAHGFLSITLPWVCELLTCLAPAKEVCWPLPYFQVGGVLKTLFEMFDF